MDAAPGRVSLFLAACCSDAAAVAARWSHDGAQSNSPPLQPTLADPEAKIILCNYETLGAMAAASKRARVVVE